MDDGQLQNRPKLAERSRRPPLYARSPVVMRRVALPSPRIRQTRSLTWLAVATGRQPPNPRRPQSAELTMVIAWCMGVTWLGRDHGSRVTNRTIKIRNHIAANLDEVADEGQAAAHQSPDQGWDVTWTILVSRCRQEQRVLRHQLRSRLAWGQLRPAAAAACGSHPRRGAAALLEGPNAVMLAAATCSRLS